MADPILSAFVKEALAAGKSRAEIAAALDEAGWSADQATQALAGYADIAFAVPVPRPRRDGSAREAFFYIVYFSLLGIVAGYVGALAFAFIDVVFADNLLRRDWRSGASGLRWAVASLLVGYPIFLALGSRLAAGRRRNADKRQSRVRAWLTYVTLIFAAGALIGDLVAVVYQFLAGDLGVRFLAKALVVGAIAGAILLTYVRDAERESAGRDLVGRAIAIAASVVTAGLVLWAFTVFAGPGGARARVADDRRVEDLGVISRLADCAFDAAGEVPASLDAMSEALRDRALSEPVAAGCAEETPVDPVTGAPYRYERLDPARYRLCATFGAGWPASENDDPAFNRRRALSRAYNDADARRYFELPLGPGEACFEFRAEAVSPP